jgi:isopenicillin N synthase-like dioxygenase
MLLPARLTKDKSFFIGREDSEIGQYGFYGPNNWPDLPEEKFRGPVWDYYEPTSQLGRIIWEILLQGLGHSTKAMDAFAKKPVVALKLLRYPASSRTLSDQFGCGSHTDFGGVTVLLQQPGKDGLEVWLEDRQEWLDVPALEDVFVVNCGDMIHRWSNGQYKSVQHRVINKSDAERMSGALFWHGDVLATNPLNPDDPDKRTVGQLWMKRFKNQMSPPKDAVEAFA